MVWRPYSQAPEGLQAEKLIFCASRRVFLWTLKALWKTTADPVKTLKYRPYRRVGANVLVSRARPGKRIPTLSWHQAAVWDEEALWSGDGKGKPVDLADGISSGLPSIGGTPF
ncbi:hypothetical protein O8B93_23500 [Agrobacterium rhizogenes]|nr:hypothetical protein [Rhizobium rhizogenes]